MKETLEEAAEEYSKITLNKSGLISDKQVNGFIAGAKWQQEQSKGLYTEEEVYNLLFKLLPDKEELDDWSEQFKKK